MANTYKILGQKNPASTNVDLYAPGAGKSAVLSTIAVANTSASDAAYSIYAQQTVPLGSIWSGMSAPFYINGTIQKKYFINDGSAIWAFGSSSMYGDFIHKSTDNGDTWIQQPVSSTLLAQGDSIVSIYYLAGKFVIYWTSGFFSVSSNGTDWSQIKYSYDVFPVSSSQIKSIIPTSTGYLAISATKEVAYSTDGETWTEVVSNLSTLVSDDLYNGSLSLNESIIVGSTIFSIATFNDMMMMNPTNTLLKSSDEGVTWSIVDLLPYYSETKYNGKVPQLQSIFFKNNKIIVADTGIFDMMNSSNFANAKILTSSDSGLTWTENTPLAAVSYSGKMGQASVYDVVFANGKYYISVADTMGGGIFESLDLTSVTYLTPGIQFMGPNTTMLLTVTPTKILTAGTVMSTDKTPADNARAIAYETVVPANTTVKLALGITLGEGDKISVGGNGPTLMNVTYTAFGSEITA